MINVFESDFKFNHCRNYNICCQFDKIYNFFLILNFIYFLIFLFAIDAIIRRDLMFVITYRAFRKFEYTKFDFVFIRAFFVS